MKTLSDLHIFQFPATIMIGMLMVMLSLLSFKKKYIFFNLFLHPETIVKAKQYYRLVTADFVHNDYMHLLFNLIMLFTYGANLEAYLNKVSPHGTAEFLTIYLASCIFGSVIVTVMQRKNFDYSSAGASGSIMGCLCSYSILQPKETAFFLPVIGPVKNIYFGLICIAGYVVYQRKTTNTVVNHDIHFFGAFGGIITTLLLFPGLF